ncbi:MAG: outer membrane lipoprotein-sorting protein [Treponema sp.]|nr:outer membrane lipoprotein-sorting protein [Treponema sp.]
MNSRLLVVLLLVFAAGVVFSQTAEEILRRVDNNEVFTTIEYEGEMIIEHQGRRYVKLMKAWARGSADSFIEFTNPEDRGTKYLKRGGRLYMYSPDNEGVMLISGHMLKESMMGSDFSYEDAINNDTLSSRYTPVLSGSETINGREAWVLDLTARGRSESYPKRKLWVDRETGDVLRYELFALSGAKLKEYNMIRIETLAGRRFPVEVEVRDLLRRDSKTTMVMRNVILDRPIPDSIFSQRNLER